MNNTAANPGGFFFLNKQVFEEANMDGFKGRCLFKRNETYILLIRLSIKVKMGWGVCEKDQGQ